ncbi:hypothetical protein EON66_11975 [archaeon]|nr:MAG: hypothetical protein EON66_11975 [archaeon]
MVQPELMSGDEACYCRRCKKHQPSEKVMQLYRLPHVLVLQLKRFTFSTFRRTKLDTAISIPLTDLDMLPLGAPSGEYAAQACAHTGIRVRARV